MNIPYSYCVTGVLVRRVSIVTLSGLAARAAVATNKTPTAKPAKSFPLTAPHRTNVLTTYLVVISTSPLSVATRRETEALAEELQNVILESVRHGTRVGA